MSWLQGKVQTVVSRLMGDAAPPPDSVIQDRIESIRESMLEALGPHSLEYGYLRRRISYASDVQVLWYLRGELMAALAAREGELAADRRMRSISGMFDGLLPRALGARSSPLRGLERSGSQ
jgi:hypothetical protein